MAYKFERKEYFDSEIAFKKNLSDQIDRINLLFSTVPTRSSDMLQSQRMLVETEENAIKALEVMLSYYHDDDYKIELKKLDENSKDKLEESKSGRKLINLQEYCFLKYELLMKLMGRHKLLLKKSVTLEEGKPDREENVA